MVDTLELVGVALRHNQAVLPSLEVGSFMKFFLSTSGEVPFPVDIDIGAPLPLYPQPGCLLLVSIGVDH